MMPHTLSQAQRLGSTEADHSAPTDHAKTIIEELWAADPEAIVDAVADNTFAALSQSAHLGQAALEADRRVCQAVYEFAQGLVDDLCSPPVLSAEAHFQEFKSRYKPSRFGNEEAVRDAFFRLPWGDVGAGIDGLTFLEEFWEGFERWEESADWQKEDGKYIPGALKFLQTERWREPGQKRISGRPALGVNQIRRMDDERRAKLAQPRTLALARGVGIFEPEPLDKRTVLQVASDNLIAALDDPKPDPQLIQSRREAFLQFGGKPSQLRALEAERAERQKAAKD